MGLDLLLSSNCTWHCLVVSEHQSPIPILSRAIFCSPIGHCEGSGVGEVLFVTCQGWLSGRACGSDVGEAVAVHVVAVDRGVNFSHPGIDVGVVEVGWGKIEIKGVRIGDTRSLFRQRGLAKAIST